MLKKAGLLTVGVTAGLLAVAPIASAGVGSDNDHKSKDKESSHEGDHHKKDHGKKHHKSGDREHSDDFDASCDFTGGNAGAGSEIDGDSLANAVAQAPVAGNNIGNLGNCSSFLNHNLNDNFSGNDIDLL